jgi:hypothetical protein
VVALLAVLLLGGGGGNDKARLSKADYESQVSDVIRPIGIAAGSVSVPAQLPNVESERLKIADQLGKLKTAFSAAAGKLEAIEPPSDVEAIHTELVSDLQTGVKDIDAAQAASDTGDSKGYETALTSFEQHLRSLDAIERKYAAAGYRRLGSGSGAGPELNADQQDVADTVANAQRSFRDKDVNLYCLSRTPAYMGKVYGGSYAFASCKKAGVAGLKAEIPSLLRGGDLTVKSVSIAGGGKGNVATVKLTGDGGAEVTAIVKRDPPDDPPWRVDSFSAG